MIEVPQIEFVGRIEPHSSIYSDRIQTVKVRKPDDTVGNFYFRLEIDRDGSLMFRDMMDEKDNEILQTATDKLRDQGHIAILDAGCGTGRTLYKAKGQLIFRTGFAPETVTAVGINNEDFSDESEEFAVRDAIAKRDIQYVVGDLETVKLPSNSFDLITSYEVLIHNKPPRIAEIVRNLLPSLKDDGLFIFDIHPFQKYDHTLKTFLEEDLQTMGYEFSEYGTLADLGLTERIFVRIRRSPTEEN